MARCAKFFAVTFMAVMFCGMIPRADAQVAIGVGHRHHHRRHHHYHHRHR
jgi:hypothetical protein